MVQIIQPIVESSLNIKFDNKLASEITLSPPITPTEHKKAIHLSVVKSKNDFQSALTENGSDITNFLASNKSYNQYNRDRLDSCFESHTMANERVKHQINSNKHKKPKKHHGNFENYQFNKELFLHEVKQKQGDNINWSDMARNYNVLCNGKTPLNGGQVLYEFAKHNNIHVNTFNKNKRISNRDYLKRIRRAKKTILINKRKVPLPTPRSIKSMKTEIKKKLDTGELYIGIKVAHKQLLKTKIGQNGDLNSQNINIHSRKIPLEYIRKESLHEAEKLGVLRTFTDEHYEQLTEKELHRRLERINETVPTNRKIAVQKLKTLERTRKLKMWHDHSDILNHSYVSFMVSCIYDEANFLTNEEFQKKFPENKTMNVQSIVEKPKIYLFGQSGTSMKYKPRFLGKSGGEDKWKLKLEAFFHI